MICGHQRRVPKWDNSINICRYPQHRCMTVASSLEPSPCQSAKCCLVSNPYDAELDQAVNQAWSKDIINSDFWMGWSIYCAQVVRIGFYLVHISSTKHNPMAALFVWRGWFFGARLRDGFCKLPGGRWDRGPTAEIDPWGRRPWKIPSETGTVRQSLRFLVIRKGRQAFPSTSLKVRNWEISLPEIWEITEHVPKIVWTHGISIFASCPLLVARVCA